MNGEAAQLERKIRARLHLFAQRLDLVRSQGEREAPLHERQLQGRLAARR